MLGSEVLKNNINKHNAELQRADAGTKVPWAYFPTQCPKCMFIIAIVLVEKKTHKIDISHAIVISVVTSPLS